MNHICKTKWANPPDIGWTYVTRWTFCQMIRQASSLPKSTRWVDTWQQLWSCALYRNHLDKGHYHQASMSHEDIIFRVEKRSKAPSRRWDFSHKIYLMRQILSCEPGLRQDFYYFNDLEDLSHGIEPVLFCWDKSYVRSKGPLTGKRMCVVWDRFSQSFPWYSLPRWYVWISGETIWGSSYVLWSWLCQCPTFKLYFLPLRQI